MRKVPLFVLAFIVGFASLVFADADPKVFKFKGLYLGMSIQEATKIMEENVGGRWEIVKVPKGFYSYRLEDYQKPYGIHSNKNKKVEMFVFHSKITDDLFNTHDVDISEFVQRFVNAYGITMMVDDNLGWVFQSSHGYRVIFTRSKELIIKFHEEKKKGSKPSFD